MKYEENVAYITNKDNINEVVDEMVAQGYRHYSNDFVTSELKCYLDDGYYLPLVIRNGFMKHCTQLRSKELQNVYNHINASTFEYTNIVNLTDNLAQDLLY